MAAERWPRDGVPSDPVAWLVVTGRRRAIDRLRRQRVLADRVRQLEVSEQAPAGGFDVNDSEDTVIADERLELIFTCCHPALALEAQVGLTLRTLGGLANDQIARLFLVSEETMKRRLSRARVKIRLSGIPFAVPDAVHLPDRLTAVLAVVYLIFTEGWEEERGTLAREAVRLGRLLAELMPDEPEVHGLLGLMLIHEARRQARVQRGELVLLGDQDRSLWDAGMVRAGRAGVDRGVALRGRGFYVLQGAIAALQSEDPIEWTEVGLLYEQLFELSGSPVVKVNWAVAVAEAGDVGRALEMVESLASSGSSGEYRYVPAVRAELLRRLGRDADARHEYRRALELAESEAERRFLARRVKAIGSGR